MTPTTIAPSTSTPTRVHAALALLRTVVGVVFIAHGAQKLFVFGLAGVTGGMEQMGVPLASLTAPAVSLIEFLGGIALVAGLFTRVTSVGLAAVMLGAMLFVHLPEGFFAPGGIEFPLTLFAAALALALAGPGAFSLDAWRAGRSERDALAA